jgi:streptogramin lyase
MDAFPVGTPLSMNYPHIREHGRARRALVAAIAVTCAFSFAAGLYLALKREEPRPRPVPALARAVTIAGDGPRLDDALLSDPFGVAVASGGDLYATDGAGGRLVRIGRDAPPVAVAAGLDMPSAVAEAPGGHLVVANTGAHTIVRIDPATGAATVLAGEPGASGFADGGRSDARFDGPVGVAVAPDGTVFVADTYNDRIRVLDPEGRVRTLAGGEAGYADGAAAEARFDTPCGIALAPDGAILVADSGNHRIRRVDASGIVTTIAGTGEEAERDGPVAEAAFAEPSAIALRDDRSFFVTDASGASVRLVEFGEAPRVSTVCGSWPPGLADGDLARARFDRPSTLAVGDEGQVYVADAGNGLVRALVPAGSRLGFESSQAGPPVPATAIRAAVPPRWPFDPPDARREVAATFGEVRGVRAADRTVWFHNGLDVPGAYGETVRAVHDERVRRPLPVEGAGGPRERLRLPLFGYIHLRVGRDKDDQPLGVAGVTIRLDAEGKVARVRVRRGTVFRAGDPLGTLNDQNHVHMIAGPSRGEVNALAALELPGLADHVAPVIEGVSVTFPDFAPFVDGMPKKKAAARTARAAALPPAEPRALLGPARILVRAYDRMDGNADRRRLGLYRVGYQILRDDGAPVPGFEEPRFTIEFERLPPDPTAAGIAYADGSQSGYTGETVFVYVATNVVRDGEAREDFWDAGALPAGRYVVRAVAEDLFGNRATRDLPVTVGIQIAETSDANTRAADRVPARAGS